MSKHPETEATQGKNQSSLEFEKKYLVKAIKKTKKFGVQGDGTNRKKNKNDSIAFRQQGNQFFKSRFHNVDVHAEILKLYSQSVALAPNDSEELSAAYGNRSALLFHLKKFEECLKDCDLALSVCKSDESKAKFLCRKVECLSILRDSKFKETHEEVRSLIDQMNLSTSMKEKYANTLKKLKIGSTDKDANKNEIERELPTFTRQKEAPCASEAIAIKYNKEWGRHIVATRNIEPGEIVVLEKSYCSFVFPDDMWFYCQNCVKLSLSSIPCEHCIYGIYCSKECRQEAWEKFHKFECEVFPYIWDINQDLKGNPGSIRLLLLAINEVGGINELKKEISEVERDLDPREKGFKNGVFHSDKFRSIFSLNNIRDFQPMKDRKDIPLYAVAPLYYLATRTTLFGKKIPEDPSQLLSLDDALFFGALIARLYFQVSNNFPGFSVNRRDFEMGTFGYVAAPFCSLFNHSCVPNTVFVKSENNEMIVYVNRPIHEGEQLFVAYLNNNYQYIPKQERQMKLAEAYRFNCECMACLDDWTIETMPSAQNMLLENPKSALKIGEIANKFKFILKRDITKVTSYEPKLMKELAELLKVYAEVLTAHCQDYICYSNEMYRLFQRSFGTWFKIPNDC